MDIITRKWHFTMIENSVLDSAALTPWAKLVYVMLSRYADRSNECFPGIKAIAVKCGCSENTVRVSIKTLQKIGILTVTKRKEGKVNMSNLYQLHAPQDGSELGGVLHEVKGGTSRGEGELETSNDNDSNTGVLELIERTDDKTPEAKPDSSPSHQTTSELAAIEQAYFNAWAGLRRTGKVGDSEPSYTYGPNRAAIKRRLKQSSADDLIKIIEAAMDDDWIVEHGFALTTIFTDCNMNKLTGKVRRKVEEPDTTMDPLTREISEYRRGKCKG